MIKIRLARYGVKKKPFYRIVATNKERKRTGKVLEVLGYWKPSTNEKRIDRQKLLHWIEKGALVNKSVADLIDKEHGKTT
jgi:small subunit ribosomal protein S16